MESRDTKRSWYQTLFTTTKEVSAVHLADDHTLLVTLSYDGERAMIKQTRAWDTPEGALMQGVVVHHKKMIDFLREIKRTTGIETIHCVVPESTAVVFHTHVLRPHAMDELQQVIEDHLSTYIKLHAPLDEARYTCEYEVIHQTEHSVDLHVTVMPTRIYTDYQSVIRQAGFRLGIFETDAHIVSRMCVPEDRGYAYGVVHIGRMSSWVGIAYDGTILQTERFGIGFEHGLECIMKNRTHDRARAVEIFDRYGILPRHRDTRVYRDLVTLFHPLRESLENQSVRWKDRPYAPKMNRSPLTHTVLSGIGGHIRGMDRFFEEGTGRPVLPAFMWKYLSHHHDGHVTHMPPLDIGEALRFSPALALAIHAAGIDVRPSF